MDEDFVVPVASGEEAAASFETIPLPMAKDLTGRDYLFMSPSGRIMAMIEKWSNLQDGFVFLSADETGAVAQISPASLGARLGGGRGRGTVGWHT